MILTIPRGRACIQGVVLTIFCLCFLAACQDAGPPQPETNPHVAALEQVPAFQLAYPGAVLLRQGASPPVMGIDGKSGAVVGKVYGIPAPVPAAVNANAILLWYRQQLQAQGWAYMLVPKETSYEAEAYWISGKDYALVGIYDPLQIKAYEPSIDTTKYPLVFHLSIGERGYQGS